MGRLLLHLGQPELHASTRSGCATGTNTIAERPTCAAGTLIEPLDRRFNSAEDLDGAVDPDLKPMQEDEYQLGLTHELSASYVVGARFIHKDLVRTIEDVGIVVPGIGEVYYIANPGEGISLTLNDPSLPNFPKAERDYTGLELTFQKPLLRQLGASSASYTYSELLRQLLRPRQLRRERPHVAQRQPVLRPHRGHLRPQRQPRDRAGSAPTGRTGSRAQFIYRFGWDMTCAVNQYLGSGIPISEQAFVGREHPVLPLRPRQPRPHRHPDADRPVGLPELQDRQHGPAARPHRAQPVRPGRGHAPPQRADHRARCRSPRSEFFAGGWDYEALLAANPNLLDARFNQPDQYQAPREVRLSLRFRSRRDVKPAPPGAGARRGRAARPSLFSGVEGLEGVTG